jgi:hypothetical protein
MRGPNTPAPVPDSQVGPPQMVNNGRVPSRLGSVNPRESAERSPATSIMPTPQRPLSHLPPEEPKPITQTVPQRPSSAVQRAQAKTPASFQATIPPPQFLQQPPPGPRKKAPGVALPNQVPHPAQHMQMTPAQQAQLVKRQEFLKFAAAHPQRAEEFMRRLNSNAAQAQNLPARSSPLASGSGLPGNGTQVPNQQARAQVTNQAAQAQALARNSPHLMQQQIAQQRGSPLLTAGPIHRPSPSRSPMPGTPQPTPASQPQPQPQSHQQQMQQMQQMQLQQYQLQQMQQQMQANMGQQYSAPNYAAMAAQFLPRQGVQGQNQQNINRTGTPQHVQPSVPHQQMQRTPIPHQTPSQQPNTQHPQQGQTQQALQQRHSASIINNLPYHPTNMNFAQLQQQMANYNNNPAWRAAALQAGHGMPPLTPQQQQQLMMAQMMGRGMGQKPPQQPQPRQ